MSKIAHEVCIVCESVHKIWKEEIELWLKTSSKSVPHDKKKVEHLQWSRYAEDTKWDKIIFMDKRLLTIEELSK